MEELHTEELATHGDPESCAQVRKGMGEALTGVCTGTVLSREIRYPGAPTLSYEAEGHTGEAAIARIRPAPRGRRPVACADPSCARTGRSHGHPSAREWRVASERPEAGSR